MSRELPPSENLMLCIDGRETSLPVPVGFWQMEREGLCQFIKQQWPGCTWASNGEPGIYAINLYFEPSV